ncbi:hypothetical protein SteCoe_8997 [Stentor coeruleus]|uniref:Uncharacterized protein n=1 Tax=Stentor coeruleus TaxID=5963 RepID=A0A1R2CJ09_9CILI|nr:hypothetical protein SteCoe_8997 [Stentor coeruleus]
MNDNSIGERNSLLSKFSSINLDLPVSDDSSETSEASSIKMKISGLGHNITQEKWNFSLVLMETIVDTLLKVTNTKLRLLKLKKFITWKLSKYDCRIIQWTKCKKALEKIQTIFSYLKRKRMLKYFSKWNEQALFMKLKAEFDVGLEEIKNRYKTKLMMMSQEINDLNEKQLILEKNSAEYIQKEKSYKASIRALEENAEPKESTNIDELNILQNENIRLKAKLQGKESKLISYFESLSLMIDNAPINIIK